MSDPLDPHCGETQGAKEVVSSVLGVRSALLEYTITRANSLLRYFPWVACYGPNSLPLQEDCAWSYLQFLGESGSAATTGASFVAAVRHAC